MLKSSNLLHVARYEFKLQGRSWLFRVSVLLVVSVIFLQQYVWRGQYEAIALSQSSSYIPFECAYIYNYLQALILIFILVNIPGRHKRLSAMEVFHVRPVSNAEWVGGMVLGVGGIFLLLNLCAIGCGIYVNLWWSAAPFSLPLYFFYMVTLNVPVFFFMTGISLVLTQFIRHRGIVLLLLLSFLSLVYAYLGEVGFGIWDMWGRWLPNIFSELAGHPIAGIYSMHRVVYMMLGGALLVSFLFMMPRLEERGKRMRWGVLALTFWGVGIGGGVLYACYFAGERQRRDEFRKTYSEYRNIARLRVVKHDISCTLAGDSLYAVSKFVLGNKGQQPAVRSVFYLNPGLQVKGIYLNGEKVAFERKNQVVICEREVLPGEMQNFTMEYAGTIDETIGYLDIPDEDYYDTRDGQTAWNGSVMPYRKGRRFCFSGNHTRWLSEDLWYPACVPPVNLNSLFAMEKDDTRFTLKVVNNNGGLVISQGHPRVMGDTVAFELTGACGGIMLCAGDYKRRSLVLDSLVADVYYYRGHEYMFEGYHIDREEIVGVLKENFEFWERGARESVQTNRLLFVETPLTSFFPGRSWAVEGTDMQPGVLFIKERGVGYETCFDIREERRRARRWSGSERDDRFMEREYIHKLRYMFQHKTAFLGSAFRSLYSEKYPAVYRLLEMIRSENLVGYVVFSVEREERELMELFARKSFREMLFDSTLNVKQMERIIYLKAMDLQSRLFSRVPESSARMFFQDFFTKHSRGEVDIAIFLQDFSREFGVDFSGLLDECYSRVGLPCFKVKDALIEYSIVDEAYYVHFQVYNDSDVDGVIAVTGGVLDVELPGGRVEERLKYFYYPLEPHQGKHIRVLSGKWYPQYVALNTNLSRNLPRVYAWEGHGQEEHLARISRGNGDRVMRKEEFLAPEKEIVVDNEDAGFTVVKPGGDWKLSWFKNDKSEVEYTALIDGRFHGYPVRSAVMKQRGSGNWKAVWSTEIEKAGKYEIFVYRAEDDYPDGCKYYYTIYHGAEKEERIVGMKEEEAGWVSLGDYFLLTGKASIELDDRGRDEKRLASRDYIIADAVKWVYRGE